MTARVAERLTTLPDIPKEFGEDGGHFYRYYDELADEIDEDLVKSLKAQLDGILIFAGLFAGVNSAFLAITLPQMSIDPADDTNALLFEIMVGGNGTIKTPKDPPSASFVPSSSIYSINILFSLSLTLALLASFLAVLGQQWLVYYRRRGGGGAEHQRWEQLRRYLGAKRWKLELILDDILPSLLQMGLVIFSISFVLYLGTLSYLISYIVAVPMGIALLFIFAMAISAAWDNWCPYKSPLSHLLQPVIPSIISLFGKLTVQCVYPIAWILQVTRYIAGKAYSAAVHEATPPWSTESMLLISRIRTGRLTLNLARWFARYHQRPEDDTSDLEILAVKRVLCTSEDHNALVYAAINLQAMKSKRRCRILLQGSMEDFLCTADRTSFRSQSTAEEQANEFLVDKSRLPLRGLYNVTILNLSAPCLNCDQCLVSLLSIKILATIILPSIEASEWYPNVLDIANERLTKPAPLKLTCCVAWSIILMKDWFGLPEEERKQGQREQLRLVNDIYYDPGQFTLIPKLSQAIATISSPWPGRPHHGIYAGIFDQALFMVEEVKFPVEYWVAIHQSLVTLLRAFESRIREPECSVREVEREYISRCTNRYRDTASHDYWIRSPEARVQVFTDASEPLQEYGFWIKEVVRRDSANIQNASSLETLQTILGFFPDPEELVGDGEGPPMEYSKQLSTLKAAVKDIENALGGNTRSASDTRHKIFPTENVEA